MHAAAVTTPEDQGAGQEAAKRQKASPKIIRATLCMPEGAGGGLPRNTMTENEDIAAKLLSMCGEKTENMAAAGGSTMADLAGTIAAGGMADLAGTIAAGGMADLAGTKFNVADCAGGRCTVGAGDVEELRYKLRLATDFEMRLTIDGEDMIDGIPLSHYGIHTGDEIMVVTTSRLLAAHKNELGHLCHL